MTKKEIALLEKIAKMVENMFYIGHPLAKKIRAIKDE